MLYGDVGGGGVAANPMRQGLAAMMGRRRRRPGMGGPMGGLRQAMMAQPGLGGMGGQVDPGFEMQPGGGNPLEMAGSMFRQRMLEGAPGEQPLAQDRVRWGGQTFQDPNKLWGWIQKHGGGQGGREKFWELHPDAAKRLGVDIGQEANPMDPNKLRADLVNQMTQAQGALGGLAAPGVQRVAANRMRAVGAAQGRAHSLAQIMSRRLRGRRGYQVA